MFWRDTIDKARREVGVTLTVEQMTGKGLKNDWAEDRRKVWLQLKEVEKWTYTEIARRFGVHSKSMAYQFRLAEAERERRTRVD